MNAVTQTLILIEYSTTKLALKKTPIFKQGLLSRQEFDKLDYDNYVCAISQLIAIEKGYTNEP